MKWQVKFVEVTPYRKADWDDLQKLLDDDWEPFAVTSTDELLEYHVKKRIPVTAMDYQGEVIYHHED